MHGYSDEQLAQMSKDEMIEALKKRIKLRNSMGGALYWNITNDECIELAQKCVNLGADINEIKFLFE